MIVGFFACSCYIIISVLIKQSGQLWMYWIVSCHFPKFLKLNNFPTYNLTGINSTEGGNILIGSCQPISVHSCLKKS